MSETVETAPAPETTSPAESAPAPAPAAPAPEGESEATLLRGGTRVVPEKYEFTAPELDGRPVEVDPEALGSFEAKAREAGLTQEQFSAVAQLGTQLLAQKIAQAQAAAVPEFLRPEKQAEWQNAIKSDPEIGGDKLGPALGLASKAIDRFGGAELRDALDQTRAGNNPAIVRAFIRIGRELNESEGLSTGRPATTASKSPEQAARDLYGTYPALTS